jgi:hypothetical protein
MLKYSNKLSSKYYETVQVQDINLYHFYGFSKYLKVVPIVIQYLLGTFKFSGLDVIKRTKVNSDCSIDTIIYFLMTDNSLYYFLHNRENVLICCYNSLLF